ncbi:MAG: glycoside hydrolase family 11 protein [Chitinispirillia bacterium]|nr:glycoside hydrolase family 11 protein [Chitinispirillia bacterium]
MKTFTRALCIVAVCSSLAWAQTWTTSRIQNINGYDYELWSEDNVGSSSMTITGDNGQGANARGGTFTCEWNNTLNILFRSGRKWSGSSFSASQGPTPNSAGNISIDFASTWSSNDGARMVGVYGWAFFPPGGIPTRDESGVTRNFSDQIEYYIIQDRGGYNPGTGGDAPGGGVRKGSAVIDGIEYDFWVADRINRWALTGNGNVTFKQYFSVPRNTSTGHRTTGMISVSRHFEEWERVGMRIMDCRLYEVAMKVESYTGSRNGRGTASVTRNILTIGGGSTPGNHALTTSVTPAAGGTITRTPNAASYAPGTSVTLTQTPNAGYTFSGWSGACTGTGSCVVTMSQARTVTAAYTRSPDAELVTNGNFSGSGTTIPTGWSLDGGTAATSVSGGNLTINITAVGADPWQPQLTQRGVELVQGRNYILTFTARSVGGGRNLGVLVQRVGDGAAGWDTYASDEFALTTTSHDFSMPFTMTAASDPNAQLAFHLGGSTNNVIISNVSLRQTTSTNICLKTPTRTINNRSAMSVSARSSAVNVNFSAVNSGETTLRLYNLKGDVISSARINTTAGRNYSHSFNQKNLPNGFYMVRMNNGNAVEQARVIVPK